MNRLERLNKISEQLKILNTQRYVLERELDKLSKESDKNSPFKARINELREEYYDYNIDGAQECARDEAEDHCREEANQPINDLIDYIISIYSEGDSGYEECDLVIKARRLQADLAINKTFKEA